MLLAVCAAARAGAGVNAWTGAGPYGAIESALAFDPSNADRVYCGVPGDVFASTDGGATWARVGSGLRTDGVFTYTRVAVDPHDSIHLLASAADEETESGDGGIYESTDGGATWRLGAGSANLSFTAVAFSPVSPSQAFAATLSASVMASTDGGATWNDPSGGSFPPVGEGTSGSSLTVLPSNPPSLLVGGSSGEVWKSTDAGGTWNKRTAGVPGQYVESISASPVDPSLFWASGSGGVFKSHNSGDTWTATAFPPVDLDWAFPTVTADPASTNDAWEQEAALVYRTTDGGKTWIPKTNSAEILPFSGVFINANRPGTVWLSTKAGLDRTTDSGATWADSSTGLIGSAIATVALSPSVAGPIYAGSGSGVAVSSDGGLTWSPSRNGVDAGFYFNSIAVDPQNPATAYSAGSDALSTRSVLLTRNGGNTWTSVSTPFSYVQQISVCPLSSAVVLTATGTGLWRTTNSGASWTNVRAGDSFSAVAFGFANVSLAYAIGFQTGFERSSDGGVTWKTYGGREKAPAAISRKVVEARDSGKHDITIWGDGTATRSFMFIDDCVKGIDMIAHCEDLIATPINLGSSELVSINELVDIVEGIAGLKLKRAYDLDAPRGVAGRNSDNTMIQRILHWEPKTPLREGMAKTYAWIGAQVAARKAGHHTVS